MTNPCAKNEHLFRHLAVLCSFVTVPIAVPWNASPSRRCPKRARWDRHVLQKGQGTGRLSPRTGEVHFWNSPFCWQPVAENLSGGREQAKNVYSVLRQAANGCCAADQYVAVCPTSRPKAYSRILRRTSKIDFLPQTTSGPTFALSLSVIEKGHVENVGVRTCHGCLTRALWDDNSCGDASFNHPRSKETKCSTQQELNQQSYAGHGRLLSRQSASFSLSLLRRHSWHKTSDGKEKPVSSLRHWLILQRLPMTDSASPWWDTTI